MNIFRLFFIYLTLMGSAFSGAAEADKNVMAPRSIFQNNHLWTYGTDNSVIYTPSDFHDGSRGHATQMLDLIRWNALNFPGTRQELLLEASSLPYFGQILQTQDLDFSGLKNNSLPV